MDTFSNSASFLLGPSPQAVATSLGGSSHRVHFSQEHPQSIHLTPILFSTLPSSDLHKANSSQCGGGSVVRAGLDYYSISGCVVAYFCNFGWGDRACYASDRQRGSARITQVCGWYKPGSVRYNSVSPVISYSYGYESYCTAKGHNFCGRGA